MGVPYISSAAASGSAGKPLSQILRFEMLDQAIYKGAGFRRQQGMRGEVNRYMRRFAR
ncbi:hypothetical protein D3C86_2112950 [compost metagenome]